MRIAMLSWETLHSVAIGGGAAHVSELAAALARKGHDIHVFTRMGHAQSDYDHIDGVHYYRCPYPGDREFIDDVNNMCRTFVHRVFGVEDSTGKPFEVIHAHDWLAVNAMIWIKKGRRRRGIFTIHSTEYARCGNVFHGGRSHRIRTQERAGTYWADKVIAVSNATKQELAWMYEVPTDKIAVVHNGVRRRRFEGSIDPGAVKRRYGLGPVDPTVLFCGRLDYQKGPDILMQAIPRLLQQHPSARFVFVGDGWMRGQLEARARDLGVNHAVRLLGYKSGEELVELFKMSEMVCVPSRNEPFGIVVLEAWAAGKPVVVTHNGGPGEYVWHEVNGLKIFDNPNSVIWGLDRLLSNFDLARWMGGNGRKAVERAFSWEKVADETLAVYDPSPVGRAETRAAEATVVRTEAPLPPADRTAAAPARPRRVVARPHTAESFRVTGNDHRAPSHGSGRPAPARAPVAVEFALAGPDDDAGRHRQLAVLETVLAASQCQSRRHDGSVIIDGPWEQVFASLSRYHKMLRDHGGAPQDLTIHVEASLQRVPRNHAAVNPPPRRSQRPGTSKHNGCDPRPTAMSEAAGA